MREGAQPHLVLKPGPSLKLILSRKGFDSTAGGCPSPILDGRPLSLPIPYRDRSPTRFGDLADPLPQLVTDLTRGRLGPGDLCHLDPDINPAALGTRPPGWRGAFGQVGAAQEHLRRQGVAPGDLFLFWGLFRPVERRAGAYVYAGRPVHAAFGWLQVGTLWREAEDPPLAAAQPALARHPHGQPGWPANNSVYIASDSLTFAPGLPGSGLFARPLILTAEDAPSPSLWQVPPWLHPHNGGPGLTYHPPARWLDGNRLRCAPRGQEFVADVAPDLLASVLQRATGTYPSADGAHHLALTD